MSRSKKKKSTSAGQRKQEEIQKRIGKAAANAEKKKAAAPGPAEKPGTPAPRTVPDEPKARKKKPSPESVKEAAPEPVKSPAQKPEPRRGRPSRTRYEAPLPTGRKILSVGEDGGVRFPARMGLSDLFKAIRNDDPSGSGTLYIGLEGTCPEPDGHDLSYSYHKGLFTRLEALDGKKSRNAPPVLADLLDASVRELRALGNDDGGTDWYAGAVAVAADPDNDAE